MDDEVKGNVYFLVWFWGVMESFSSITNYTDPPSHHGLSKSFMATYISDLLLSLQTLGRLHNVRMIHIILSFKTLWSNLLCVCVCVCLCVCVYFCSDAKISTLDWVNNDHNKIYISFFKRFNVDSIFSANWRAFSPTPISFIEIELTYDNV